MKQRTFQETCKTKFYAMINSHFIFNEWCMKNELINTGVFSVGEYSAGKFMTGEFDEGEFSARDFDEGGIFRGGIFRGGHSLATTVVRLY